jgi:hypothetical protein
MVSRRVEKNCDEDHSFNKKCNVLALSRISFVNPLRFHLRPVGSLM